MSYCFFQLYVVLVNEVHYTVYKYIPVQCRSTQYIIVYLQCNSILASVVYTVHTYYVPVLILKSVGSESRSSRNGLVSKFPKIKY